MAAHTATIEELEGESVRLTDEQQALIEEIKRARRRIRDNGNGHDKKRIAKIRLRRERPSQD